ncbi:hypothetical protein LPJ78_005605 [Coemansia sp. RSA 989]|nr:hypothetical protein LPJ78_005605 [Coemansia sp. RSA 989]
MSFSWGPQATCADDDHTNDRVARNTPLSTGTRLESKHSDKHDRLQQRLYEVLEDNARLAAQLDDARFQIKQLHLENARLRDRFFSSTGREVSVQADGARLPPMSTPMTAEALVGTSSTYSQNAFVDPGHHMSGMHPVHEPQSTPVSAELRRPWNDSVSCSCARKIDDRFQALGTYAPSRRLPKPNSPFRLSLISPVCTPCTCQSSETDAQYSRLPEHGHTDDPAFRGEAAKTYGVWNPDVDSAAADKESKQGATLRVPGKRRKRHHDIASKVRSVQPVPRDKDGNYETPVQVGILVVLNLGRVIWDRDTFHNERYIWPVGYTVQREYYSMVDPHNDVIYTCWVSEGKDAPLFHIEAEDMPESPIVAPTATGAWTAVLRKVNQIRKREHSNSASGPDYFGFSHPTIAKMIQDLPGADRCRSYVMQNFVEMKDRHVRGVVKKGRGGRPSVEMLSRGQRALMASATSSSTLRESRAVAGQQQLQQKDGNNTSQRISVATLTNAEDAGATSP